MKKEYRRIMLIFVAVIICIFIMPSISNAAGNTLTITATSIKVDTARGKMSSSINQNLLIKLTNQFFPKNSSSTSSTTETSEEMSWDEKLLQSAVKQLNEKNPAKETVIVFVGTDSQGTVLFGQDERVYGTKSSPIPINLDYDEIIFENADLKRPFYFEIYPAQNGAYIGKYMIEEKQSENRIIFTKLESISDPHAYKVTPNAKSVGTSYLQAGAVLEENYMEFGYTPPLYKIEAYEMTWKDKINDFLPTIYRKWGITDIFTAEYWNSTIIYPAFHVFRSIYEYVGDSIFNEDFAYSINRRVLGNSHLPSSGTLANAQGIASATYPSVYVFCASNVGSAVYAPISTQSEAEITVERKGDEVVTVNEYVKDVANRDVTIVYAFQGATSDILGSAAKGIEETISKILISIGDLFMKLFQNTFGTDASIDGVIFNEYEPTIIDFFTQKGRGTYYSVMHTVINSWFKAFRTFTVIALIIVLVAMGIRAMLMSDTGDMRKIMGMFSGWIIAVVLLFLRTVCNEIHYKTQ